jgi:hypothetical protein
MAKYDAGIIQKFAVKLYSQANTIILVYTTLGALVGLSAGAGFGTHMNPDAKFVAWGIAAVVGALMGFAIGAQRAFWYKLQAQLALCQMMIEKNTRSAAEHGRFSGGGFPTITQ